MSSFLLFACSISLACTGLHIIFTWPGMLFYPIHEFTSRRFYVLTMPLYGCLTCMASVWTAIFWLAFKPLVPIAIGIPALLFTTLIVAALNTFICLALEKLSDYGC